MHNIYLPPESIFINSIHGSLPINNKWIDIIDFLISSSDLTILLSRLSSSGLFIWMWKKKK